MQRSDSSQPQWSFTVIMKKEVKPCMPDMKQRSMSSTHHAWVILFFQWEKLQKQGRSEFLLVSITKSQISCQLLISPKEILLQTPGTPAGIGMDVELWLSLQPA